MVKRRRMTPGLWKTLLALPNIKALCLLHTEIES